MAGIDQVSKMLSPKKARWCRQNLFKVKCNRKWTRKTKLYITVIISQVSFRVKCHFMSRVSSCQVSFHVKCHFMSSVTLCQVPLYVMLTYVKCHFASCVILCQIINVHNFSSSCNAQRGRLYHIFMLFIFI